MYLYDKGTCAFIIKHLLTLAILPATEFNTQQIYTLFSIVKCNSTMIKHRFYNAVDFSVRHWTLILHKNTLISATQNLIGKITLKPTQITLWLCFLDQCCPIVTSCIKKYSLTSSFYSELQNILNSSSNWNVQIWIFKTPFYPLYTCSLIKYSTLSHYCIRKSKDGRHNRTIVIHNPLSVTDKTKGEF